MKYDIIKPTATKVDLTITVEPADYKKNLESAAVRISERASIHGFRPGKAPYDLVKQQVGELKILEEAMQSIVESNFYQVVKTEKLDTMACPKSPYKNLPLVMT
jgi:trigger factor